MQIQKATITKEELVQAVQAYIATQGVTMPIESVQEYGYPRKGYEIEFKDTEVKTPVNDTPNE
jgi:hypothetical protein